MIRVVLFLLAVTVLAAGFVWVADRPGDVAITWMGYRIETSVMVAALALAALVLVLMVSWAVLRGIFRSPEQVALFFRHRRAMKGYLAISRGLIAIGALAAVALSSMITLIREGGVSVCVLERATRTYDWGSIAGAT